MFFSICGRKITSSAEHSEKSDSELCLLASNVLYGGFRTISTTSKMRKYSILLYRMLILLSDVS